MTAVVDYIAERPIYFLKACVWAWVKIRINLVCQVISDKRENLQTLFYYC